jgi:hypothetical protein
LDDFFRSGQILQATLSENYEKKNLTLGRVGSPLIILAIDFSIAKNLAACLLFFRIWQLKKHNNNGKCLYRKISSRFRTFFEIRIKIEIVGYEKLLNSG